MTNGGPHFEGKVHLETSEREYDFGDQHFSALKPSKSSGLVKKKNSNGLDHCSCESCCTYSTPMVPPPLDNNFAGEGSNGKHVLDETLVAMGCSPALFLHEQGNFDKGICHFYTLNLQ